MPVFSLGLLAVFLVVLTTLMVLIGPDWRFSLAALALQFVGVLLLVLPSWPLEMAATKLIAGWMAGVILAMALLGLPPEMRIPGKGSQTGVYRLEARSPSGRVFRGLGAVMVLLTVFSLAEQVQRLIPGATLEQTWGGLVLIGMSLLQLGFTARPLYLILALQTMLAGFEIFYAVVESSSLVAGLLAGVHLGLAMVGAYLIAAPTMAEEPE